MTTTGKQHTHDITFSTLLEKDCIHLIGYGKWDEARDQCRNRNADLFVPGDFMGMLKYIDERQVDCKCELLNGLLNPILDQQSAFNEPSRSSGCCPFVTIIKKCQVIDRIGYSFVYFLQQI